MPTPLFRPPRSARRVVAAAAAAVAGVYAPDGLRAQAPGLAVLQGAFPGAGFAVAVNGGRADGQTAILGAVGFGARSGALHLDLGVGALTGSRPGYRGGQAAYGGRLAVRAAQFVDGRFAVTPFLGFGSTRAKLSATGAGRDATIRIDQTPVGAAVGGRFALGTAGRTLAMSAAPFYALYRQSGDSSETVTRGQFRTTVSVDAAVTPRVGLSLGVELGQRATGSDFGARGTLMSAGAAYAFGRRP